MDFNDLPIEGNNENLSKNQENIEIPQMEEELIQPPSKDDMIVSMKLKNKIMRYKTSFPHIFEKNFAYKFEHLDEMTNQELENLILELSIMVNSQNSTALTQTIYFEGIRVVEILSPMANIQIQGLHQALKQNQSVIDCLNEISLKYEDATHTEPEIRLVYATIMTAVSLHKLNSSDRTIDNFLQKQLPKETLEKYNDL